MPTYTASNHMLCGWGTHVCTLLWCCMRKHGLMCACFGSRGFFGLDQQCVLHYLHMWAFRIRYDLQHESAEWSQLPVSCLRTRSEFVHYCKMWSPFKQRSGPVKLG